MTDETKPPQEPVAVGSGSNDGLGDRKGRITIEVPGSEPFTFIVDEIRIKIHNGLVERTVEHGVLELSAVDGFLVELMAWTGENGPCIYCNNDPEVIKRVEGFGV